jgi:hypothetical protein
MHHLEEDIMKELNDAKLKKKIKNAAYYSKHIEARRKHVNDYYAAHLEMMQARNRERYHRKKATQVLESSSIEAIKSTVN